MFQFGDVRVLFAAVLTVALAGCGAANPANPANSTCGGSMRSGITDCPEHSTKCQIGTYCNTDRTSFTTCLSGCTSDENCAANQHCLKCDTTSTYGTCQDCSVTACVSSCAATAGDSRCLAPGSTYACKNPQDRPPASAGSCQELDIGLYCCGGGKVNPCHRDIPSDPLCQTASLKKAFLCPPDGDAPGCVKSNANPLVYCCN